MQKLTHIAGGVFAAALLNLDPVLTTLGAIAPDIDTVCCHRKLLHNVWVLAAAFLYDTALGVGVLSHLVLDSLTVSGVALLWPVSGKRFGIKIARTGGMLDWVLFVLLVVGAILIVV